MLVCKRLSSRREGTIWVGCRRQCEHSSRHWAVVERNYEYSRIRTLSANNWIVSVSLQAFPGFRNQSHLVRAHATIAQQLEIYSQHTTSACDEPAIVPERVSIVARGS